MSAPKPKLSKSALTLIAGRSVALNPAPRVYAPAENKSRCQGISTSFHFTTPIWGNKATTAPKKAIAVALTPCHLSVTQSNRTTTKIKTDFQRCSFKSTNNN